MALQRVLNAIREAQAFNSVQYYDQMFDQTIDTMVTGIKNKTLTSTVTLVLSGSDQVEIRNRFQKAGFEILRQDLNNLTIRLPSAQPSVPKMYSIPEVNSETEAITSLKPKEPTTLSIQDLMDFLNDNQTLDACMNIFTSSTDSKAKDSKSKDSKSKDSKSTFQHLLSNPVAVSACNLIFPDLKLTTNLPENSILNHNPEAATTSTNSNLKETSTDSSDTDSWDEYENEYE